MRPPVALPLTLIFLAQAHAQTQASPQPQVQTQPQPRPEFEVASVRLIPPSTQNSAESYMPTLDIPAGGALRILNRRLDEIIMLAYGVGVKQISGPGWLTDPTVDPSVVTRYEILAKVPEGAKKDQIPLMLQKLLEDRFKLQVHREARTSTVYALEIGKGELKLQPTTPNALRAPGCNRSINGGAEGVAADCYSVTSAQLATQLQSLAPGYFREGPIVDRTGLTGTYDLSLHWLMQAQIDAGMDGPTMFAAVEKLGLKLNKKKDDADMLIVDHCEQVPTDN